MSTKTKSKVTKRHHRIVSRAIGAMPPEKQLSAEDKAMLAELLGTSMAEDVAEEGDDEPLFGEDAD